MASSFSSTESSPNRRLWSNAFAQPLRRAHAARPAARPAANHPGLASRSRTVGENGLDRLGDATLLSDRLRPGLALFADVRPGPGRHRARASRGLVRRDLWL